MENKIQEKKGHGALILIIILIILLIATVGYIVYDKVIEKPDTDVTQNVNISEKKEKEEEVDINSSLVQYLFNIFKIDSCYKNDIEAMNTNNLVKLRTAYENISKTNFSSIECSKIGSINGDPYCGVMSEEMSDAYSKNDTVKFKEYEMQNMTRAVDAKILENKVYELFGSDYKFKNETFGIGNTVDPICNVMSYNSANNIYAEYNGECGGTCAAIEQKLISATKNGEKLTITTTTAPFGTNDFKSKVIYEFKKDKINSNYVFAKVTEEK